MIKKYISLLVILVMILSVSALKDDILKVGNDPGIKDKPIQIEECFDSDDLDYYNKGSVILGNETFFDECTNNSLHEYFCINNTIDFEEVECFCEDGVCLKCDVDEDGFLSIECNGNDCDDFNKNINPDVKDICDNGIDENCDSKDKICKNETITGEVILNKTSEELEKPKERSESISGDRVYIYGPDGLVATKDDEGIKYYHTDYLGSIRAITDVLGNLIFETDYFPFGNSFQEVGQADYKYTGKEKDDTSLYYYGARYYDADLGRFTQVDPILTPSESPYAYVKNNPLKFIDPSGEYVETAWAKRDSKWGSKFDTALDQALKIELGAKAFNSLHKNSQVIFSFRIRDFEVDPDVIEYFGFYYPFREDILVEGKKWNRDLIDISNYALDDGANPISLDYYSSIMEGTDIEQWSQRAERFASSEIYMGPVTIIEEMLHAVYYTCSDKEIESMGLPLIPDGVTQDKMIEYLVNNIPVDQMPDFVGPPAPKEIKELNKNVQ